MSIIVILKNTTGSNLTFSGRTISAGGQRELTHWCALLRKNDALIAAIDSGDIVVNNGTSDLSAERGKAHLYAPMFGEVEHMLPGTACLMIPVGTTAERPTSPMDGMLRYNSETSSFEVCESVAWSGITDGGGKVVSSATGSIASMTIMEIS